MQITLNQAQIEQAITDYIGARLTLAPTQALEIDLRATRGAEGYTAVVDVVDGDETPFASATATAKVVEKPSSKKEPEPEAEKPEEASEPAAEEESGAPATPKKSIFAKQTEPA